MIVLVIFATLFLIKKSNQAAPLDESLSAQASQVTLITAQEFVGNERLSIIGSVRAVSEATITTERGGRITSVPVSLGQTVSAGQIIATIENASERASLLQAEGVYEAAVAASAQNDIGTEQALTAVKSARNNAVDAVQSAYNITNSIVRNNLDTFFANPDHQVPGLRIDGRGYTAALNTERVAYQSLLAEWQTKANTITSDSILETELLYSKQQLQRTISFVDTFLTVFSEQSADSRYSEAELQSFQTTFTSLRTALIAQRSNIDAATAGLSSSYESLRRAELTASGGVVSAADAQVKQAQGALLSAQANYAKTILRSPIAGTVNSLTVRTGEYTSAFSPIAMVINDKALEILTAVSETERKLLAVGDEVTINADSTGMVSAVAPAINSETGKFEVRITSNDSRITAGETVRITKTMTAPAATSSDKIIIPLSAVKFSSTDGSVFMVVDEMLVAKPVSIGTVRGETVEILSGISATDSIVRDVRGLNEGESVTVQQ